MIVADTSYIVEGILTDETLLSREAILTPDLAVYEAVGAIWKHQKILGRLTDGLPFLTLLFDLIKTNKLLAIGPDEDVVGMAYEMSLRHHSHPHDTMFVAMAVKTGFELKTFDSRQEEIFEREKDTRRPADSPSSTANQRGSSMKGKT